MGQLFLFTLDRQFAFSLLKKEKKKDKFGIAGTEPASHKILS